MSFTPKARRTKSRDLKGTNRLPCYVVCICLSTNRYQKYKSVELGDQLEWYPTRSQPPPCIASLDIFWPNTYSYLWAQGQLRQPTIFLFDVSSSLGHWMHILSLQMTIRRAGGKAGRRPDTYSTRDTAAALAWNVQPSNLWPKSFKEPKTQVTQ